MFSSKSNVLLKVSLNCMFLTPVNQLSSFSLISVKSSLVWIWVCFDLGLSLTRGVALHIQGVALATPKNILFLN